MTNHTSFCLKVPSGKALHPSEVKGLIFSAFIPVENSKNEKRKI
jgi:hypothetical protein